MTTSRSPRPPSARLVFKRLPLELPPDEAEFVRTTFDRPPLSQHRVKRCSACDGRVSFDHSVDLLFCASCDVWLEPRCAGACRDCQRRPERPSHRRHGREGRTGRG